MSEAKIALHVEHDSKTKIAEVYNCNGNIEGIILDINTAKLMEWDAVMKNIPKSFGPVLAEHLLDWASQYGYVILKPAPIYKIIENSNNIQLL